ncbi:MAG: hypothetical protein WC663_00410 [Patescibacteria group bacterium]|jgi:hypothetical protein
MPQNSPKKSQNISDYFQNNNNKMIILGVFIISLLFIIFGTWIYFVTFIIPQEPVVSDITQKRLKIDTEQYQDVIQSLTNDQESITLTPNKNPYK